MQGHECPDTGYVQQPQSADRHSGCCCGAQCGAYAAPQWPHWTVVVHKPPPSKIKVPMDTPSLIPWDLSSPALCWPAEGSALQLPLFAHSSGSWRSHTHLAAKIRWNTDESRSSTKNMFLSFTSLLRQSRISTLLQRDSRFYLPCPESPRRCLSSWAAPALKDWVVQPLHLCPAPESLQKQNKWTAYEACIADIRKYNLTQMWVLLVFVT